MKPHETAKLVAIVPAGGIGERANIGTGVSVPKQYRLLHGVSMLRWSVRALLAEPRMTKVLVGVQTDDAWAQRALDGLGRVRICTQAGPTRALTVLGVLEDGLAKGDLEPTDWVLVHDAARPGLPRVTLQTLIDACLTQQTGGLLAMPATDTVKQAVLDDTGEGLARSAMTLLRQTIWLAQTPQMFRGGELRAALRAGLTQGQDITDEASAMEAAGTQPLLVPGSHVNFKVTWPQDFEQMERVLSESNEYSHRSGL